MSVNDWVGWAGLLLAIVALPPVWGFIAKKRHALAQWVYPQSYGPVMEVERDTRNGQPVVVVRNPQKRRLRKVCALYGGGIPIWDRSSRWRPLTPGGEMVLAIGDEAVMAEVVNLCWIARGRTESAFLRARISPPSEHHEHVPMWMVAANGRVGLAARLQLASEVPFLAFDDAVARVRFDEIYAELLATDVPPDRSELRRRRRRQE